MSVAGIVTTQPFALSAHVNGIYNARTISDGGITSHTTNEPIVQVHEREITGIAVPSGISAQEGNASVSEVTIPVYLAYDDAASALHAAAGMRAGKGGAGEVSLAFERPGTVKIAWLGNRKKQFYQFTHRAQNDTPSMPDSLQTVFDRMTDRVYAKEDGMFSTLHSVPSVQYQSVDVKEVECTRIKIPKATRPIVSTDPAPATAANGSTVYPPGKYIVLFGFATMRCNNAMSSSLTAVATTFVAEKGWGFWLKVCVEVVLYAIEIASVLGTPYPGDSTPAFWTVESNLVQGGADSIPVLDPSRLAALRRVGTVPVKRLQAGPKKPEKRRKKN